MKKILFTDHRFLQEHHEHRGDVSCLAPRPSAESQGHHLKRIAKRNIFLIQLYEHFWKYIHMDLSTQDCSHFGTKRLFCRFHLEKTIKRSRLR